MTALSIETTDDAGTDQRELFIENHAWTPNPPPQGLELNIPSYRGCRYWWNQKFRPMEQVVFPDRLTRITGWATGHSYFISGLTFHFGNASAPLTLGHQSGAAIDFFVNTSSGEYVTRVSGIYYKSEFELHRGRLSGLRVGSFPRILCRILKLTQEAYIRFIQISRG